MKSLGLGQNSQGFVHLLVPMILVVVVGLVGTILLVSSHADTPCTAGVSWINGKSVTYKAGALCMIQAQENGGAKQLVFSANGNLVFTIVEGNATRVAWASGTSGVGKTFVLQNDGNMVVKDSVGKPVWQSNSAHGRQNCYELGFQFVTSTFVLQESICSPYRVLWTLPASTV